MSARLAVSVVGLLAATAVPAPAHRLDEYLQATTIHVERARVRAEVHLTPGVSVFPEVFAAMDRDGDGRLSDDERAAYGESVVRDLGLRVDGDPVPLWLVGSQASSVEEMKEGRGGLQLDLVAEIPPGGRRRTLFFENRHQAAISAYLANCIVPSDPRLRITGQSRNYPQSVYRVDYEDTGATSSRRFPGEWLARGGTAFVVVVALGAAMAQSRRS
jgi:hypothetical protein